MQVVIVVAAILVLFWLSPPLIDAMLNRSGPLTPRPDARGAHHHRLWIADLHADSLLWNRDLLRRHRRGHVDLPRLRQGNVDLQVFTAVTKVPLVVNLWRTPASSDLIAPLVVLQRWPVRSWFSLHARARHQASKLHELARRSDGGLVIIKTMEDLEACDARRREGQSVVAALLGVEGAQALEGRLSNLDGLFDAGFRLLGLSHFFDTDVAGSAHGLRKGGLTPLGRQVVARMEELGMIVDLAHASPAAIDDVVAMATKPVIVSHTGVRGTCDNPRNLTDEQLEGVAATGGLIGIAFFRFATCGSSLGSITRAIRHTVDRVGVEHVALGSDFDGAVRTPFDSAALPVLTDALIAAGFGDHEVEAIMGGNVRRLLPKVLPTVDGAT